MNTVTHKDNEMKIKLTLPWKHQTFVHYYVSSLWPVQGPGAGKCRVEVTLEGPYEILYDIICQKELSTNLREVSQCPEKAPTMAYSLLRTYFIMLKGRSRGLL